MNLALKFSNLFENFSLTKSFKKKFAKVYRKDAPILKPITTTSEPIHFPKMKPERSNIGDPNPKSKTQIIVKIKKDKLTKKKLLFLS